MLHSWLFWRLVLSYLIVVLVLLAVLAWLLRRSGEEWQLHVLEQRLQESASFLAAQLQRTPSHGAEPEADLQQTIQDLASFTGSKIRLFNAEGRLIAPASSGSTSVGPGPWQEALAGRGRAVQRSTEPMPNVTLAVATTWAGSAACIELRGVASTVTMPGNWPGPLWLAGGGAVAVALLLAILQARDVARTVVAMTRSARAIAEGDASQRVVVWRDDELGRLSQAFNAMADELHTRMARIQSEHNKLAAVLDGMVEGVVAVDQTERVLHMNDVAAGLLEASAAASLGQPIWDVTRVVEVNESLRRALQTGRESANEVVLPWQDQPVQIEIHSSPLRDHRGEVSGALVVLHDVSKLRRLESVRRDFVANVSHELKTPLTAIRGLVETILDDNTMPVDTRQRFLAKIQDQCARLHTLVADLLTLSRIESKETHWELTRVDLGAIAAESVRSLMPAAERKNLTVDLTGAQPPVMVMGDAEGLRQVCDNLLDNAIKYTANGGRVSVQVSQAQESARLAVTDTGIGIAPMDQDRIFERFYRVDRARSRELGGTGLGLSIVKNIVLRHGGQVQVESSPGVGSRFWVDLPLDRSTIRVADSAQA